MRHFRYREKQDLKIKNGPTKSPIEEEDPDADNELQRLREELRREEEERFKSSRWSQIVPNMARYF